MNLHKSVLALAGTLLCSFCLAESVDYRLPPEIQPLAQAIELRLDPATTDYSGKTVLQINVLEDVERLGIYQLRLDMNSITLRSGADVRTLDATIGEYDINWLSDGDVIVAGQYELSIEFTGLYVTDSLGMHRAKFEGNDYIFTQMESMYLRRSIPSFDEPAFKIPYQLTIEAPEGLVVVANTPVEKESTADGWQRVEFMPTKPLSSYLIAYAVGPLDSAEIVGMSVPGRVYVPKGHADELGFVLRHTPRIVKSLEEYFGSNYPFRKLDFVAVPEFAYGAMENAGLITYRTDLLMIGDHATGKTATATLSVIAHEVAHQWFGDLVTMEWWNDLWLNEAFASWMTTSTMRRVYPEYEYELDLPQAKAFPIDQSSTTKPIRKLTRTESDVNEGMYLPYVKGQALLRMLEKYVGEEKWQAGIRSYMKEFSWGNATEPDLWRVISEESGIDVSKIAGSFLNQPGYPILSIDEGGKVSQTRYFAGGQEPSDLQWTVPLNVKYKKDGDIKDVFYLLDEQSGTIDLPQGADWIMPDAGAGGYFRWQTDADQFYALVDDIDNLDNAEKIALLDNSAALLQAGRISLEDYMFVITRSLEDSHPLVLLPAVEKVLLIGSDFVGEDDAAAFGRFVDTEFSAHFENIGLDTRAGDSEAIIQLRPRLFRLVGQHGLDPAPRTAGAKKADLYLASPEAVDANLATELLRVTALYDDGKRYEKFIDTYMKSSNVDLKSKILDTLYFQDPAIINAALDFSVSDDVPAGDTIGVLVYYARLQDDQTVLYEWLEENLAALEAKIPSYYHQGLPELMVGPCNVENLGMMKDFFSDRDEKYATSLGKALESLSTCIERRDREGPALTKFLERYNDSSD